MVTAIGFIAFLLTFLIQLPQAIKVYKTKHTSDLSIWTYIILTAACSSWLIYGLLKGDLAIWTSNGIGLIIAVYILMAKLKYK